jgi:hypothetical protein
LHGEHKLSLSKKKITTAVSPDTRIQAEITSTRTLTSNETEMLSEEISKRILLNLETLILTPPPQPPPTTTVSPDVPLKLTAKILTQSTPRPLSPDEQLNLLAGKIIEQIEREVKELLPVKLKEVLDSRIQAESTRTLTSNELEMLSVEIRKSAPMRG